MKNMKRLKYIIFGALLLVQSAFAVMTFGPEGAENFPIGGKPTDFNRPTEPKQGYIVVGTPVNNQPSEVTKGTPGVKEFIPKNNVEVARNQPHYNPDLP